MASDTLPGPTGLRILVVEDEAAIAMLLEDMLVDLGSEVIGPASRLPQALKLVFGNALVFQQVRDQAVDGPAENARQQVAGPFIHGGGSPAGRCSGRPAPGAAGWCRNDVR